jgi:hypothetical protein
MDHRRQEGVVWCILNVGYRHVGRPEDVEAVVGEPLAHEETP